MDLPIPIPSLSSLPLPLPTGPELFAQCYLVTALMWLKHMDAETADERTASAKRFDDSIGLITKLREDAVSKIKELFHHDPPATVSSGS